MDTSEAGDASLFMCKICNLFSPSQEKLLTHVSEKHTIEGVTPDDIIVPLRPLSTTVQPENSGDGTVKRKRGRPKGSTKKIHTEEVVPDPPPSPRSNQRPDVQAQAAEEQEDESSGTLDCKKCNRKFCNRRQITKHICIIGLKEEGDEEEDNDNDPDAKLAADGREEDRERTPKRARSLRSEKVSSTKDLDPAGSTKKPIISVVLTAHEAIPGATKIVPIEALPADPSPATDPDPNGQAAGLKKGYQEYAIQQAAYEVPLKSNRLGQTQLKIFTCEYCNKVFKFKHSLQAHLRIHTNEKPFKCPQCDYASAIKANLSVHMRKHTGEKFSCEHCSFNCLSKGHLKVHVERVHKKIKQHCRFCKKKYSDVKNLLKHMRESHDMEDKKVKDSYEELSLQTREGKRQLLYDCQICDRKFKNELDRDRHMMVHGNERPFGCELCDHGSTKYQALQVHVRKHPFVYVCATCMQKFVSSVRLRTHLREAHPEAEETAAFADSINRSFCLLEPGGDIQREALKQEELQMTEELSLLNTQEEEEEEEEEALVPELGSSEEVASEQGAEGLAVEAQLLVRDAAFAETLEGLPQEVCAPSLSEARDAEDCPTQETTPKAAGERPLHDGSDPQTGADPTTAQHPSQEPSQVPLEKSPLTNPEESSCNQVLGTDRDTCSSAGAQAEEELVQEMEAIPQACSGPDAEGVSSPQQEKTAFRQIIDSMQKRQLNMEVFERIRKVYGDLECEYCGKLFWYQVHYNMHVRTHTREHLHYCSQCSYSSITKNCLKRHVIQRHSDILLKCPSEGCQYCTPDKYKLKAHLKIHSDMDRRSYVCPVCEQSFPEDRLIKSHIKTFHPDVSMSTMSEVLGRRVQLKGLIGKRASKCPYCDCYFMRNGTDLQQHIWAHEGVKPYKCSLCEYATRSKSNLKAHMNRHNTEKTHLCDLCGKKFKSKCTLKSHKLMHTADGRQFKCTECDYTAAQKPQLLRHMEQHASFKPFRCAHCHYSCNMSGSLKRHYNKKHPNEQYSNAGPGTPAADVVLQQGGVKCPVCNYVYGTKWEMNRHLKNKHGLKLVENDGLGMNQWEVVESLEEPSTQYLHITETDDLQGTEAAVSALQDLRYNTENGVVSTTAGERLDPTAVNILQQIIELGSENHDATVASVVAMAPGTVTVVEQVAEEEQQPNHAVMIQDAFQQASVGLGEEHHLVVSSDDVEGIETVTVYTQGEDASQFIVYVQEAVQADEQPVEAV
ncbi:zinc finger protein ZFAT-like isoform X2 [Megalops cyprinoides]|uniref:zinc finger protein ZFAT-like isoform X2 n=1 Tax=Megalops cyprinoides TaxID=118141 RepID=UPI0018641DD5|nr:zinc finger protein ZFAT-like isoform X2 [Megalops cyprinoides]